MDIAALRRAYRSPDGVVLESGTLYIAGTREFSEVLTWPALPWTSHHTARYRAAARYMPHASRVVGHSLGGAVAADLGVEWGIPSTSYGSPKPAADPYANLGDPVSWFGGWSGLSRSHVRARVGHDLDAYG